MSEETKAARKTPGKMTTWIGRWGSNEDGSSVFLVEKTLEGATDKDIKAVIKGLGYGKYDILTGRCSAIEFKEVVKTAFV